MADGTHLGNKSKRPSEETQGLGEPGTNSDAPDLEGRVSFGLIDPAEGPSSSRRSRSRWARLMSWAMRPRFPWLALVAFAGALIAVAVVRSLWLKTLLPLALIAAGIAIAIRFRLRAEKRTTLAVVKRAPRALVLDASGLRYELVRRTPPSDIAGAISTGPAPLRLLDGDSVLQGASGFGATLLSNSRRDRLALAITSTHGTFLVGARLEEEERAGFGDLFARSWVLGTDDAALDATGPDGQPVCLPPTTFRKLYESLLAIDPGSASRVVLSDQRGAPLLLDGETLTARGYRFDLSRPIEWRAILFQESFGHAITLYQGTWIRQGTHEVVLVSLLSQGLFDAATRGHERAGIPELDRMAIRDQRLLQAAASDPPPVEQRVAMDGLFVVPLRAALDEAPRPSSEQVRARHA
ncbi:MAG: IMP dehydrogenase [Polyangiaceae bacterium]|nr:IMP dehydrogenase [Polyangiaceae bacterium]